VTNGNDRTARELGERVRPQIENAKRRLSSMNESMTDYIKENPGKCLVGALAVGYLIGKIASRRG